MAPAPSVAPDKVIITVGELKLTAAQWDNIIASLPQQYQVSARGPGRKQFADAVVRILALSEEGRRRKLDQTPAYQIQSVFAQDNLLAGATAEQVGKEVKLDDAEMHKYYDEHQSEFQQAHARHILIRMQGSPSPLAAGRKELTDAEALAKAQEIRKKLDGGADFATLAKDESDDTGSATNGGDLGTVPRGQMVAPFEQAEYALKPGEMSQPVKTQFGYHIIKLESINSKTFEEVKPDLERRMRPQITQKAVEDLVKAANPVLDPDFFGTAKQ
jgi:peptidyl-prolyl cis-trans isomerase C